MTIQDNRDGAFGMTYTRELLDESVPSDLLNDLRTALFITDDSFDDKLNLILKDAISDVERMASISLLAQVVTVHFEYFKGKYRLPFGPVFDILEINDVIISRGGPLPDGMAFSNGYFTDNTEGEIKLKYEAGSTSAANQPIPQHIKRLLVKMAESKFKNEVALFDYPASIYGLIRSISNWMD